jgi:hypothetical protein
MSLESYGQELSRMLRLMVSKAMGEEIWLLKVIGTSGLGNVAFRDTECSEGHISVGKAPIGASR